MPKNLTGYMNGSQSMGKNADETDLLKPGAREPASTVSPSNKLTQHTTSHKPFGKLGNRGMGK